MSDAVRAAMNLLARGTLSSGRLREKLLMKGHSEEETEAALDYCIRRHYLDDEAFARRAWERGLAKGYTGYVLERRLRALGIDAETAALVRAESEEEEADEATERPVDRILRKIHKPGRPWDTAERRRCMAALSRRGFDVHSSWEALRRLEDTEKELS